MSPTFNLYRTTHPRLLPYSLLRKSGLQEQIRKVLQIARQMAMCSDINVMVTPYERRPWLRSAARMHRALPIDKQDRKVITTAQAQEAIQNYEDFRMEFESIVQELDVRLHSLEVSPRPHVPNDWWSLALSVWNPQMWQTVANIQASAGTKRLRQVGDSIERYLISAAWNPTPRGLWAGVETSADSPNGGGTVLREHIKAGRYTVNPTLWAEDDRLCFWYVDETQTATLRSIKALPPIQQAVAQDDLEPLSQKIQEICKTSGLFVPESEFRETPIDPTVLFREGIRQDAAVDTYLPKRQNIRDDLAPDLSAYFRLFRLLYGWSEPLSGVRGRLVALYGESAEIPLMALSRTFPPTNSQDGGYQNRRILRKPSTEFGQEIYSRLKSRMDSLLGTDTAVGEELFHDLLGPELEAPRKIPRLADVVFQVTEEQGRQIYIPEQLSQQPGRLLWRYAHLLSHSERRSLANSLKGGVEGTNHATVLHWTGGPSDPLNQRYPLFDKEVYTYFPVTRVPGVEPIRMGELMLRWAPGQHMELWCPRLECTLTPWFPGPLTTGSDPLVTLMDMLYGQGLINVSGHVRLLFPEPLFGKYPRFTLGSTVLVGFAVANNRKWQ